MKVITLYQPYASLIANGDKTIETRTHDRFKNLAGERIAIHAGKKYDDSTVWIPRYQKDRVPYGVIVCTVRVSECRWLTKEDTDAACIPAEGRFGLVLKDVEKLRFPIPVKGRQGIWNFDLTERCEHVWKIKGGFCPVGGKRCGEETADRCWQYEGEYVGQ